MTRKVFGWGGWRTRSGFTVIELMISIAVLAVILAVAIPNFTQMVRSGRAEMAAKSFARAVASARATASQTGRRTELVVRSVPEGVSDCDNPAWMIVQGTTLMSCMTEKDFSSRYEGADFSPDTAVTITYLPTGIASNTEAQTFSFSSGTITKTVTINAGGTTDLTL